MERNWTSSASGNGCSHFPASSDRFAAKSTANISPGFCISILAKLLSGEEYEI